MHMHTLETCTPKAGLTHDANAAGMLASNAIACMLLKLHGSMAGVAFSRGRRHVVLLQSGHHALHGMQCCGSRS